MDGKDLNFKGLITLYDLWLLLPFQYITGITSKTCSNYQQGNLKTQVNHYYTHDNYIQFHKKISATSHSPCQRIVRVKTYLTMSILMQTVTRKRKNNYYTKRFKNCAQVSMWGLFGTFHRLLYLSLGLNIQFLQVKKLLVQFK